MASVVVTATAKRELKTLTESHSLPHSTASRLRQVLEPLHQFPLLGADIGGRWTGIRFIVGPWRWMLILYRYDQSLDRVEVISIQDGRSAQSPMTDV